MPLIFASHANHELEEVVRNLTQGQTLEPSDPAAALADWAFVICLLSILDHTPEYKVKKATPGGRNGKHFLLFVSIAAPRWPRQNHRRVQRPFRLYPSPFPPPQPSARPRATIGLHEPKWDGFRFQIIKDGANVRFYSHRIHRPLATHGRGLRQAIPDVATRVIAHYSRVCRETSVTMGRKTPLHGVQNGNTSGSLPLSDDRRTQTSIRPPTCPMPSTARR